MVLYIGPGDMEDCLLKFLLRPKIVNFMLSGLSLPISLNVVYSQGPGKFIVLLRCSLLLVPMKGRGLLFLIETYS